jgi:hypothetical protein
MNYGERVLLSEPGVQVTSARFVVGHQTYPIMGITSVTQFYVPKPSSTVATGCGLAFVFGFFPAFIFAVLAFSSGSAALGWTAGFFGLAGLAVVGISIGTASVPNKYGVAITSAGSQVRPLVSQDLGHVQRVVGALNHALSMRG